MVYAVFTVNLGCGLTLGGNFKVPKKRLFSKMLIENCNFHIIFYLVTSQINFIV